MPSPSELDLETVYYNRIRFSRVPSCWKFFGTDDPIMTVTAVQLFHSSASEAIAVAVLF